MLTKVGLSLIILATLMFTYGISIFTYIGNLSLTQKDLGEYSFVFWLPVLLIGTIITIIARRIKK